MMTSKQIFTPHLAVTPFGNHNDGNRLHMSASQIRQTLPLASGEPPLVTTGYEHVALFLHRTSPCDGIVEYVHPQFIIIRSGEEHKLIRLSVYDAPTVAPGDNVYEGQLIAVPQDYCRAVDTFVDPIICYGVNVYTSVINHPSAYEDAYVISSSCAQKFDSSRRRQHTVILSEDEFLEPYEGRNWFPPFGVVIQNEPILIIRDLRLKKRVVELPFPVIIDYIDVIPNRRKINTDLPRDYASMLAAQIVKKESIVEEVRKITGNDDIAFLVSVMLGLEGEYANKTKNWSAVIKIGYREVHMKIELGDKITNRHAGKGVISMIQDDSLMPYSFPDRQRTEIILNPMSIISRMNVGTLFELISSRIVHHFRLRTREMIKQDYPLNEVYNEILTFYDMSDKTEKKYIYSVMKKFLEKLKVDFSETEQKDILTRLRYTLVAPPFSTPNVKDLEKLAFRYVPVQYALKETLINSEEQLRVYTTVVEPTEESIKQLADVYNLTEDVISRYTIVKLHPFVSLSLLPQTKQAMITNSGWLYYLKLVHLSSYKLTSRAVGKLSTKYLQPKKLKDPEDKARTGQRVGEMETMNLISWGCTNFLRHLLTYYSDDVSGKLNAVMNLLFGLNTPFVSSGNTASLELIRSYLKMFDVDL